MHKNFRFLSVLALSLAMATSPSNVGSARAGANYNSNSSSTIPRSSYSPPPPSVIRPTIPSVNSSSNSSLTRSVPSVNTERSNNSVGSPTQSSNMMGMTKPALPTQSSPTTGSNTNSSSLGMENNRTNLNPPMMGMTKPALSTEPQVLPNTSVPSNSMMGMTKPALPGSNTDRNNNSFTSPTPVPSSSMMGMTKPALPTQPSVSSNSEGSSGSPTNPISSANDNNRSNSNPSMMGMTKPALPGSLSVSATNPTAANDNRSTVPTQPMMGMTKPTLDGSVGSASVKPIIPSGPTVIAAPQTASARAITQQMSAEHRDRFAADQQRASKPAEVVNQTQARQDPVYNQARSNYRSMDDYYADRSRVQDTWRSQNSDAYGYARNMRPNYSTYDSLFLAALVANAGTTAWSAWAYAHHDQPWYQDWHRDMEMQAQNEQNAQLRERLARLDQQVADMSRDHVVPQSANQLPPGVNPAIVVAPEAFAENTTNTSGASAFDAPLSMPSNNNIEIPKVKNPAPMSVPDFQTKPAQSKGIGFGTILLVLVAIGLVVGVFVFLRKR